MGGGSHSFVRRAGTARGDGGRHQCRLRLHRLDGGGGAAVHHLRGGAARGALRVRPRPRLQRLLARRRRAVQEVPDLRPDLRRAAGGGARRARARSAHLRAAQVAGRPGPMHDVDVVRRACGIVLRESWTGRGTWGGFARVSVP
eukprot:scaffold49582_cov75-Phaeocystis_antarctica.AAC.9